MSILTIHLAYRSRRNVLPVKVIDAQGTVLAEGLVARDNPIEFTLPDDCRTVFVRLLWPSGMTDTQKAALSPATATDVTFSDTHLSAVEWAAWAAPRLTMHSTLTDSDRTKRMAIAPYDRTWIRLWHFSGTAWKPAAIVPKKQHHSDEIRQIDLTLDTGPYLLQVGGSKVPWRFVSLPCTGRCRILLIPNDSKDPRAEPLKVIVTGLHATAETLMEFLARDAMHAAGTMADSESFIKTLFEKKHDDPVAAVAGAYFLLRIGAPERVPSHWWNHLDNLAWIPDVHILRCIRLLRAGLNPKTQVQAIELFKACIDHGWPIYAEGIHLLHEACSLLRHTAKQRDRKYFDKAEMLATAKTWAGSTLSFYGRTPSEPSAVLWVGMPNAPRRRKLSRPAWAKDPIAIDPTTSAAKPRKTSPAITASQPGQPSTRSSRTAVHHRSTAPKAPPSAILKLAADVEKTRLSSSRSKAKPAEEYATQTHPHWLLLSDIGN
ncbi:MAG: hypothetical protein LBV45_05330 [Xanthomonadaceae bacterium]|jgi:hypothetical protein|nr:hypothetical protein [Xanthomonadaceae bacterium]